MKILGLAVGFVLLALLGAAGGLYFYLVPPTPEPPVAADSTLRQLSIGEVIGFQRDGVDVWLGVPFAQPPVGNLRWRAPQAKLAWDERLEALQFGPACPQAGAGGYSGDENCLQLNVWSPEGSVPGSHPVMVWIHGGGNSIGDSSTPIYHGDLLAQEHDIVVVSIQYRLGPLGWFRHPALRSEMTSPADDSGNYGTLDIVMALEWVQQHVSQFGGDPDNVTIFGESAGGFDVLSMMASPLAKQLFHRAISQSGGLRLTSIETAENFSDDAQAGHRLSSKEVVNKLLQDTGLAANREAAKQIQSEMSNSELADTLRRLTPQELLNLYSGGYAGMLGNPDLFGDGYVLPRNKQATEIFSDIATYNSVPVMLGSNRDETKLFLAFGSDNVTKTFGLPTGFGDLTAYNRNNRYGTDSWKIRAVDDLASAMLDAQESNVFAYRFDVDDWRDYGVIDLKELLGAAHALEIPFVFGKFIKPMRVIFPDAMQGEFDELSSQMRSYWAEFAYTGNPGTGRNHKLPVWKTWDNGNDSALRLMVFDTASDSGVRMDSERLSTAHLKTRFLADTSYSLQQDYCAAYRQMFTGADFDVQEYEQLGSGGCSSSE